MDKVLLVLGGIVGLKLFADVLGMLGINVWGPGGTPGVNPGTNPVVNPSPNPPANGGTGNSTTDGTSNRPTGVVPAPPQVPVVPVVPNPPPAPPVAPTAPPTPSRPSGSGNVNSFAAGRAANNAWLDDIGNRIINDLQTQGLVPNYNFHQWNYLYGSMGSTILPAPEDVGFGDGSQIISLEQYKTAIRSHAGLGGVLGMGMGAIALQPMRDPNGATQFATPVESMNMTWLGRGR